MKPGNDSGVESSFTLPPRPSRPKLHNLCPPGKDMARVCEASLEKVRQELSELAVIHALLQLQRNYWIVYERASKTHRDHIGSRNGHTCIFQVYRYYYDQLDALLLQVNPPPLRPPAAHTPVARPQINGIFLF